MEAVTQELKALSVDRSSFKSCDKTIAYPSAIQSRIKDRPRRLRRDPPTVAQKPSELLPNKWQWSWFLLRHTREAPVVSFEAGNGRLFNGGEFQLVEEEGLKER
nr:unnamed protein product [Haemonchus contortus]